MNVPQYVVLSDWVLMSVHAEGKKLGKCYIGLHKGEKKYYFKLILLLGEQIF